MLSMSQALCFFLPFASLKVHSVSLPAMISRTSSVSSNNPLPSVPDEGLGQWEELGSTLLASNNTLAGNRHSSIHPTSFHWAPPPFGYGPLDRQRQIRITSYHPPLLTEPEWSTLVYLLIDTMEYIWATYPYASYPLDLSELSFACRDPVHVLMPHPSLELTIHNSATEPGLPHTAHSVSRAMTAIVDLLRRSGEAHLMEILPIEGGVPYRRISVRQPRPGINYRLVSCSYD